MKKSRSLCCSHNKALHISVTVLYQLERCCCFCDYMKASPECQAARLAEGAKQQFSGDTGVEVTQGIYGHY